MTRVLTLLLSLLAFPALADSMDGSAVIVKRSQHSVSATLDKLESLVKEKGFTVFARIDHAAGAASVGQVLRPTQLLIFGNPAVGTALMSARQSAALDLPIRVAAWEDANGQVWLGYEAPTALAERHGIVDRAPVIEKMTGALDGFTRAAAN